MYKIADRNLKCINSDKSIYKNKLLIINEFQTSMHFDERFIHKKCVLGGSKSLWHTQRCFCRMHRTWTEIIELKHCRHNYNEIVVDKLNEFRVFFYNGHAKYITWKTDFDNLCVNDIENIDDNITLSNDKRIYL